MTCARQSIADLSSVVIFLACDALGIEGSAVRGFRGPGRFTTGVDVAVVGAVGLGSRAGGSAELSPLSLSSSCPFSEEGVDAGADSDVRRGCDDQRGHFFASSESSGTSTTSLEEKQKEKKVQGAWHTSGNVNGRITIMQPNDFMRERGT